MSKITSPVQTKMMAIITIGLLVLLAIPASLVFASSNLILNPEFDGGTANWFVYTKNPARATFSIDATSQLSGVNSAKVAISNSGSNDADIQLFQDRAITNGTSYSISFAARASAPRTMTIAIVDTSGSPIYFSQAVNLTTSTQNFGPYTFNATVTSAASQFVFFLGANTNTVWVDNVQMTDAAEGGATATSTNAPTNTPTGPTPTPGAVQEFFDDFNYQNSTDTNLTSWWTVRNQGLSGPGPDNCSGKSVWTLNNLTFIPDPNNGSNKLMRLSAPTDGTCAGTTQAEINTNAYKFLAGTYAARVHLYDYPISGTRGKHTINETFFAISDYWATTGTPLYSELDFTEYLPNGGWGNAKGKPYEWFTSWYNDNPRDAQETSVAGSYDGWRTIVCVVGGGQMKYYVDGVLLATHGGIYYPRSNMALDFNLWYTGNLGTSTATHVEDVDWTYYAKDTSLTTAQVQSIVASLRTQGLTRKDTVP